MNTVVESISTYLILGPRSVLSSLRRTEDELTSAEIKGNCHPQRPLCKSHFCAQGQVSWAKAAVCSCAAPHSPQHNPSLLSISYLSQQQPDVSFKIYYTGSFPKDADYCSGRTCGAGSTQAGSAAPLPSSGRDIRGDKLEVLKTLPQIWAHCLWDCVSSLWTTSCSRDVLGKGPHILSQWDLTSWQGYTSHSFETTA